MKQTLLLLAMLALPTTVVAQGQVIFANTASTVFTTNNPTGVSGLISGMNTYRIGLYIAPDGTLDPSLFTLVGVATNAALAPGRFSHPEAPYSISGNSGEPIMFQIRAWSAHSGTTYESVRAPYEVGVTSIGRVTPGFGGAPAGVLFGTGPGQIASGIHLTGVTPPVPEPSTYALAALGVLLMFCCRKRR